MNGGCLPPSVLSGRADNDRTDLQELEIFTDVLPATLILVK